MNLSSNQTLPIFLLLRETEDSIDFSNFFVRDYLPLIRKDFVTRKCDLAVYVKEGLPFARDVSLDNWSDSC